MADKKASKIPKNKTPKKVKEATTAPKPTNDSCENPAKTSSTSFPNRL